MAEELKQGLPHQEELIADVPENEGVRNVLRNFQQIVNIRYTAKALLPQQRGDFEPGEELKGIIYSSSRIDYGFVPMYVSLHTFMTAIQNPRSFLYTVHLGALGNVNGHTYYGSVCSAACCYALGFTPYYSTYQWKEIDGMVEVEPQTLDALKLGDTLCTPMGGHVAMVTGIRRDAQGRAREIDVSESVNPTARCRTYTPETIFSEFHMEKYRYYRYTKIGEVKYNPSPYVAVDGEEAQEIAYNTAIIPRRGDKANWPIGWEVIIDVLEKGDHTTVEILKDGQAYEQQEIKSMLILKKLPAGSYQARLTGGEKPSDWCYWMVVDAKAEAEALGEGGKIKVDFSASNAEPVFVAWHEPVRGGNKYSRLLTDEEKAAGSVVCAFEPGKHTIRVAFRTEYGVIHTAPTEPLNIL